MMKAIFHYTDYKRLKSWFINEISQLIKDLTNQTIRETITRDTHKGFLLVKDPISVEQHTDWKPTTRQQVV